MERRILVADDDLASRLALQRLLEKGGYAVVTARDGEEAWAALAAPDAPRLAILDWTMPGLDGVEVCQRLRANESGAYTYVVLLTGRDQQADVVAGLAGGADDYLKKPFDRQELMARLAVGQRILDLQSALVAARDRLEREATHDPLTGLWNRRAVLEALHRDLARSGRDGQPVAVVLADIDHFKRINDTYGHAGGDQVLVHAGERLRACLRAGDAIARWGGEELLVLLPGASLPTANEVAERLRAAMAGTPFDVDGQPVLVTASFGVAMADPIASPDAGDLVRRADEALYRAKKQGRNRVEVARTFAHGLRIVGGVA